MFFRNLAVAVTVLLASEGKVFSQELDVPEESSVIESENNSLLPVSLAFLKEKGVILGERDSESAVYPTRVAARSWEDLKWIVSGKPPEVITKLNEPLALSSPDSEFFSSEQFLWAASSNWWPSQVLHVDFDVLWGTLASPTQFAVGARLVRVYPHALTDSNTTIQVFRERLDVNAPASVAGYSLLSYRFFGPTPDMFWVRSAAIDETRQLFEENRDSSALGSVLSLDDLFTWSGKTTGTEVLGVRVRTLLLPSPQKISRGAQEKSGCSGIRLDAQTPLKTSHITPVLEWSLTPTEVLEVALSPSSSQPHTGKMFLFLEKQSLVPILKESYGENGLLRKMVLSRLSIITGGKGVKVAPLQSVSFENNAGELAVSVITASRLSECEVIPKEYEPPFFSPANLK
jgi:hypothetical protein